MAAWLVDLLVDVLVVLSVAWSADVSVVLLVLDSADLSVAY